MDVRIVGPCVSACTVLIGYIPREHICVVPGAYLGFHWATTQFATQELWSTYPADIRQWISEHGGLTNQLIWLQAASHLPLFPQVLSVLVPRPALLAALPRGDVQPRREG